MVLFIESKPQDIVETEIQSLSLNSELSNEKVDLINKTLDEVLEKAGKLQGEIAQQKKLIKKTIEMYSSEINEFLYYAGYKYQVAIEEENTIDYHLVLKHIEGTDNVQTVNEHLSYGERNAFALVLFMYSVLKENPDLVVLDDSIASVDKGIHNKTTKYGLPTY